MPKTRTRCVGLVRLRDPYNDGTQELWAILFISHLPLTIDDEAPVLDGSAYISFSDSTLPRAPERPESGTSARP